MKVSQKIYKLRTEKDMTQAQIAKIAGVSDKAVSAWESGIRDPKLKAIQNICAYFKLDMNAFVDESLDDFVPLHTPECATIPAATNILPMPEMRKIPLLGTIACGAPVLADEHIEGQVDIPANIHADFALTCKGDSMINARIFDGDIVYIRQQDTVENGEIAAVLIETEATLKRFKRLPDRIILEPENPLYDPLVYRKEEMNEVRILGKAVAFTSSVR